MALRAFLCALAVAALMGAGTPDTASIVNSGSTNAYGYTIEVSSNGKASVLLKERGAAAASAAKSFTVPSAIVARFFADLAAARKGDAQTVPCMKSASFGSTIHITWQQWVSPDLTCPAKDSLGDALIKDVDAIRQASGISPMPLRGAGPVIESAPP
jgi:hypothetical protein